MKHLLNRLGIVGLMIGIVIWGCIVLWLSGPFVGRAAQGLFAPRSPSPLAALICPLALSRGETKTITATIANTKKTEQTYLVTMAQPPMSSGGPVELCYQVVTIPPGSEKTALCLVRIEDLGQFSSEASWYISVDATTSPAELAYYSTPPLTNRSTGDCIIRSQGSFRDALVYGGGVTLSALAFIFWGAFLWSRSKWVDRILTVLLSIVVYSLAWLMNSMVWVGLSNLNLVFLILGGMLLVMFLILWSMG